jgi:hypothetical protein
VFVVLFAALSALVAIWLQGQRRRPAWTAPDGTRARSSSALGRLAAANVVLLLTMTLILVYLLLVLVIAHGDLGVAATIVQYRPWTGLVTLPLQPAFLGLLGLAVTFAATPVFAAATSTGGRHRSTRHRRAAIGSAALLVAVVALVPLRFTTEADSPWWAPPEVFSLRPASEADPSGVSSGACMGWVLGEQATGRWLIVLMHPDRNVVAIESARIRDRFTVSEAEGRRRMAHLRDLAGEDEAVAPLWATYEEYTDDDWRTLCWS